MIKQVFTSISRFNISNILFLSIFTISFVVSFLIFISLIGNIPNLEQVGSVSTLIQVNYFFVIILIIISIRNIVNIFYSQKLKSKFKIKYIQEKKPLGTAGSLKLLNKTLKKNFFVINCDTLVNIDCKDIIKFHEQKRNLIWRVRKVIRFFQRLRIIPAWVEESLDLLQTGGQSWTDAEKAKIADLNWRIVAEKPAANF